jgi:hypothetical protein
VIRHHGQLLLQTLVHDLVKKVESSPLQNVGQQVAEGLNIILRNCFLQLQVSHASKCYIAGEGVRRFSLTVILEALAVLALDIPSSGGEVYQVKGGVFEDALVKGQNPLQTLRIAHQYVVESQVVEHEATHVYLFQNFKQASPDVKDCWLIKCGISIHENSLNIHSVEGHHQKRLGNSTVLESAASDHRWCVVKPTRTYIPHGSDLSVQVAFTLANFHGVVRVWVILVRHQVHLSLALSGYPLKYVVALYGRPK